MELSTSGRHDQTATQIQIRRRVYDEYLLKTVDTARDGGLKHQLHTLYTRLSSCSCSWHVVSRFLVSLAPIFQWLPKYSIKENLVKDLSGGLTVGIMHIPQGEKSFAVVMTNFRVLVILAIFGISTVSRSCLPFLNYVIT